jgi:hypothetical protein
MWPDDKFFKRSGLEPSSVLESSGRGRVERVKVIDRAVRKDIDLDFLEEDKQWMSAAVAAGEPFFLYFNNSNVHFPTLPR